MMIASPILVDIGKNFGTSPENINLVITFFMIGEVVGIISLILLNRVFKRKPIILWTYVILIASQLGLIFSDNLFVFYILYFVCGVLLGLLFMNANLSMLEGNVKNKDSVVNLGHGFFAVGALSAPFISSEMVERQLDWKFVFIIVIGISIVSLVIFLVTDRKKDMFELEKRSAATLKKIFKNRNKNIYMVLTAVLMLFYVMSEVTIFSWAPTFFRVEKLFDLYSASLVISIFWIGILVGRLLISVLSYKFKAGTLLLALAIISLAGLALAIFPTGLAINFLGAGLIGLGFSGIPPLLISSAGRIFGGDRDISLTILFVIGITSGSIIPFLIRSISEYSFIFSMIIAIIFMSVFLVFVLIRKAYRKTLENK